MWRYKQRKRRAERADCAFVVTAVVIVVAIAVIVVAVAVFAVRLCFNRRTLQPSGTGDGAIVAVNAPQPFLATRRPMQAQPSSPSKKNDASIERNRRRAARAGEDGVERRGIALALMVSGLWRG